MRINLRPALVIFVVAIASILLALLTSKIFVLGIVLYSLGIIALFLVFALKRKTANKMLTITLLLSLVVALFVSCSFFITNAVRYSLDDSKETTVTGRLTEHYRTENDTFIATLMLFQLP